MPFGAFCGFLARSAGADRPADAFLRSLQSRAGAGSYGALSRPLKNVFANACGIGGLFAPRPAKNPPVTKLGRGTQYGSKGQECESLRARQLSSERRMFVVPTGQF